MGLLGEEKLGCDRATELDRSRLSGTSSKRAGGPVELVQVVRPSDQASDTRLLVAAII
jgi:hypothetical protein